MLRSEHCKGCRCWLLLTNHGLTDGFCLERGVLLLEASVGPGSKDEQATACTKEFVGTFVNETMRTGLAA